MTLRPKERKSTGERGSTILEFCLSGLMVVLLILGVYEMSRLLLVYNTVATAARIGARFAQVNGADVYNAGTAQTQTTNVVKTYLKLGLMDTTKANIQVCYQGFTSSGGNCTGGSDAVGNTVSVTVSYPYDAFVAFYANLLNVNVYSTTDGVITW